jgi:polyhydroxyalkanoate synthesis repressor PhaR
MKRLIKKYKNRRLYDTELSQYITLEQLQAYVQQGIEFGVEDSETKADITNAILLQIIVEMESGTTKFLSSTVLCQIIKLANHPMHANLQSMMEQMFQAMDKPLQQNPYQEFSKQWATQMNNMMSQWFK